MTIDTAREKAATMVERSGAEKAKAVAADIRAGKADDHPAVQAAIFYGKSA